MGSELALVTLAAAGDDPELLRRVYEEVLRPSFTADELPDRDEFVEGVGGDGGDLVLVALDGDAIAGAAVTGPADPTSITLLSYLAATPGGRSRGVGSFLMGGLLDGWRSGRAMLVVAEVHDPRAHPVADDERPEDRLRFYARAGATVLGPWVQPRLSPDVERVSGMLLLDLYRTEETIPAGVLGDFAEGYFAVVEDGVPTDPEYLELRRRLDAAPLGPGVPVLDFATVPLLSHP